MTSALVLSGGAFAGAAQTERRDWWHIPTDLAARELEAPLRAETASAASPPLVER